MSDLLEWTVTDYTWNFTTASSSLDTQNSDILDEKVEWGCLFDEDQCATVNALRWTFRLAALIFGVVTLLNLVILRKYQRFSQRIFLYIMVPNLLNSLVKSIRFTYDENQDIKCTVIIFLNQFLGFTSFLWVCIVTVYLTKLIIFKVSRNANVDKHERLCIFICLLVPLIQSSLPLITNDYGVEHGMCMTKGTAMGVVWKLATWIVPVLVGSSVILCVFVIMYIHQWLEFRARSNVILSDEQQKNNQEHQNRVREVLIPFTAYAASFVLFTMIHAIDRIDEVIVNQPNYNLRLIHVIASPSYDIAICAVFYFTNGAAEFTQQKYQHAVQAHSEKMKRIMWLRVKLQESVAALTTILGIANSEVESDITNSQPIQVEDNFTSSESVEKFHASSGEERFYNV